MKRVFCCAILLTACHTTVKTPGTDLHVPAPHDKMATPAEVLPASVAVDPRSQPETTDPGPIVPPTVPALKSETQRIAEINGALQDAFFAYDRSDLDAAALAALRHDAELLRAILADFPTLRVTLEGHCDDRGSAEYNLALGDRRARSAEDVLHEFGVPAGAVELVSYGKEAPQCAELTEACRQKNRRAHPSVRHP